jgi:hypothetical protein
LHCLKRFAVWVSCINRCKSLAPRSDTRPDASIACTFQYQRKIPFARQTQRPHYTRNIVTPTDKIELLEVPRDGGGVALRRFCLQHSTGSLRRSRCEPVTFSKDSGLSREPHTRRSDSLSSPTVYGTVSRVTAYGIFARTMTMVCSRGAPWPDQNFRLRINYTACAAAACTRYRTERNSLDGKEARGGALRA